MVLNLLLKMIVASVSLSLLLYSGGVPQGKGFKCTGGIMASEAVFLFRNFYEQGNPNGICFKNNLCLFLDCIQMAESFLFAFSFEFINSLLLKLGISVCSMF